MDQQLCQGGFPGPRFTHQGGETALRHGEGNPVEHFVLLVGKADVFKGNAVIFAGEGLFFLLQRRGVYQFFQRCDLVIDLGQGGHEAQRPQQRRPRTEGHAEHQGQIRQRGSAGKHQISPDGQGEQGQAGEDAVIQRHPGPADPVPGQREIPVAPHILLKPLVGFTIPVENLHHLHAVDVFHNGVVHLLGGSVVGPHFAGAGLIHGAHGDEAQRQGAEGQQRQLPVHEKHGDKNEQRHRHVGEPLRQGVGQQQLNGVDVVNEHLLEGSHALFLNGPQRLALQLPLEGGAQISQGFVGRPVGKGQTLDVEQGVQHPADPNGQYPPGHITDSHVLM